VVRGTDVRLEAGTWLGPRCPKTGAKGDAPNRTHAAAGVHLAAALGKSAWVLVRFDSCWRWLTGRRDSPWYPALRLYRQPQAGDWENRGGGGSRDLGGGGGTPTTFGDAGRQTLAAAAAPGRRPEVPA